MPELPEVECVRRGLVRAKLRGALVGVWRSDKPLRTGRAWRTERLDRLRDVSAGPVARRGKFLIWRFDGATSLGLLVHLGMTGKLVVSRPDTERAPHTHLVLDFEDGRQVRFVDARRFGGVRVDALDALYAAPPLRDLGPEPLTGAFDADVLAQRGGRSRRAIRDVLLDQRVVAGLGNIYVLEALYRARVHPLVGAYRLRPTAWARLADAITDVLRQGIANGGTTFRDFRGTTGRPGRNAAALAVYGRAGQPCLQCGATLEGFVLGGRSGVYCPREQTRSGGRWVR
jgi:formamidopyrimidine-DNA glycosylase